MANKLTNCKTCGREMATNAKVCPSCGAKNKKPFYTRWWFIVLAVIFLIGALNSATGKGNTASSATTTTAIATTVAGATTTAGTTTVATTKATTATTTVKEFKIGDAVEYKGVRLTVTKVVKSSGSTYNKPDSGKEFLHVYLKIENIGDNKLSVSPMYFKLQTSDGQLLSYDFKATIDVKENQLNSLELLKGGKTEGIVGFTAPKGDTGLILHYYDSIISDKPIILINLR